MTVWIRRLLVLWRIVLAGTRNFFRNAWLSVAATAVMVITLTIMLGAVVFNMALGDTLDQVTESIDIALFFDDSAPLETVQQLQTELESLANVADTHYVSKAEALERYQADNADNTDILEAVTETENPLPTSLEIQVYDLNEIDEIILLSQDERFVPIIEDTSLGEDRRRTIARIADTRQFLISFGVVASLLFASISILIIFNTIRMAIFARSEEIGIMRLVGATNGFIRGPFLFESMLDGIIAAAISLGVLYTALLKGAPRLVDFVNFDSTLSFFTGMWPLVVFVTICAGILLGVISSMMAMIRYLNL
ncbi:MAG: permease-like cell division protein FtsX [Candidatus Saccharimonadales bacterium]